MISFRELESIIGEERLPCVVVDLNTFDRNARKAAEVVSKKNKTIRIASKSVRVPKLLERVFEIQKSWPESLRVYRGLMCFSAEEAKVLATMGFDDLLIAYPTFQKSDLQAIADIQEMGKSVSLVVDSDRGLERLEKFFSEAKQVLRVVIEMDCSLRLLGGRLHLGVRRSPIRTIAQCLGLMERISQSAVLKLVGVMGYEAQIAGVGDRNPFKRLLWPIVQWMRSASRRYVSAFREQLSAALQERGIELEILNGGGTGSLSWTIEDSLVHEVTLGSGLLCSHLFDYYSERLFEPACFFALQAVRSSDPQMVTYQGGGYIASGETGADRQPVVVWPEGARLIPLEGCGEVQTPLQNITATSEAALGVAFFRHAKAGELAERFSEYLLVQDHKIIDRVPTYRGLGHCFF